MSKTKTPAGLQYVDDFTFSPAQGFTGSAGKSEVKGYMRGGKVSKTVGKGGARQKMPKNVHKKGGPVKKAMGGFMGPEREIAVDDVTITVPKKRGGKMSTHDKLKAHGAKMGYAYGGMVKGRKRSIGADPSDIGLKKYKKNPGSQKAKNTSGEFKVKRGKQDSMDDGVQPARRGRTQQEIEAGGTKRLKPGYAKGGKAKPKAAKKPKLYGSPLADAALAGAKKVLKSPKRKMKSPDKAKGRGMSRKGMPENVKAKGGSVCYSQGGVIKKA